MATSIVDLLRFNNVNHTVVGCTMYHVLWYLHGDIAQVGEYYIDFTVGWTSVIPFPDIRCPCGTTVCVK